MTTAIKLGVAIAGIGTIGGGAYLTSELLKSKTLGEALKEKGHTLLNFDVNKDNDHNIWSPIVTAYLAGKKKFTDLPTINVSNNKPNKANIDLLKKACEKAIKSSNYENTTLLTSEQWCTKPISIKELISKNRVILDSEGNTNNSEWDAKVLNYIRTDAKNKLTNVQELAKPITTSNQETERNKLKAGCKAIEVHLTHNKDFHTEIDQFIEWCSNPKQ